MDYNELKRRCEEYYPDMELLGSGNVDYGHNLVELLHQTKELEDLERIAELKESSRFIEKSNKLGLNPDRVFDDAYLKMKLIRDVKGYTKLKAGNSSGKESISNASDVKIGNVFKNLYYSSLKDIKSSN